MLCAAAACSEKTTEPSAPSVKATHDPAVAATVATSQLTTESDTANCGYPVRGGEAAGDVARRFGQDATRETLPGPEGTEISGIVLWKADPARRMEILLSEEPPSHVVGVRVSGESRWQIAQLRVGDGIEQLRRVNGGPFAFFGFAWDYGGYVTDWKGGILDKPPGPCSLSLRLNTAGEIADAIMGEDLVSSDNPAVAKARPVISELSLNFDEAE